MAKKESESFYFFQPGETQVYFSMSKMEDKMAQIIFIVVLCILAFSAGIWGWCVDNGVTFRKKGKKKE